MNKKIIVLGLMIAAGCLLSSKSFAQDYQHVSMFNHMTDWSATLFKSPDDKQRIIDQRVAARAQAREACDHRRSQERDIQAKRDQENKDYQNHESDLRNQYKDDPDTLSKKLQDADNDHNAKMSDLDNQWKAAEGK